MRVPPQHVRCRVQVCLTHDLKDPGLVVARDCGMNPQRLPQLAGLETQQVHPVQADLAAADGQATPDVPQQGEGDRGLPRPGLTDQAEHVTRPHREGDPADHWGPVAPAPDLQLADIQPEPPGAPGRATSGDGGWRAAGFHATLPSAGARSSMSAASSGLRSTPSATRPIASVRKLVPMVRRAIIAAGMITAQGFSGRPTWFSLIMVPQLGAGGGWPNPRNASPAMMMIE